MNSAAPLILTAELPADVQSWANRLRRAHYPPDRNVLDAHVTLFHALPYFAEGEVRRALANCASRHAPVPATLTGVMDLGGGTALHIVSPAMLALRDDLAGLFHGLLTQQDQAGLRLHITVQNKVAKAEARALQAELAALTDPFDFAFRGLALHAYLGGPWKLVQRWSFRG